MKIAHLLLASLLVCPLASGAAGAEERPPRIAIVVGANGAPAGRKPLLFSHRDAETMAEVLASVGGFRREDVVLLEDPSPGTLVKAVEGALARLADRPHSLLYFYYSGHADDGILYPGGQALSMASLKRIIDEAHVATKIGLVDACRGGGWTRAKGLVPDAPFAVHWPVTMDSEGSVLIASSSGQESAHESDHLQGSFFTVHFAAGLRGAADANGNKQVTLTEAFEYARERTIRDTVRLASETQHPSYAVNLRGRSDLVLAEIDASPTTVQVDQSEGPLQIIHAASGVEMVEIPAGKREIRVAVPPGRYLIRKSTPAGNLVQEITVSAGIRNHVDERDLVLVGQDRLAVKAAPRPVVRWVAVKPAAPVAGLTVTDVPPPPPPPAPPVSGAIKSGAWTSLVFTTLFTAVAVKFSMDYAKINRDLDPYRRYPCPPISSSGVCYDNLTPAPVLTPAEQNYVDAKKADGRRLATFSNIAGVAAGVAALSTGFFFWRWHAQASEPRRSALRLLPLADADGALRPGLVLAARM
jgi:hypothetical protein